MKKLYAVLPFIALFIGCEPQERFRVDVQARTRTGEPIEIYVYTEPLTDGGYVINVKRQSDPPGKCWGTVIYPVR